MLQLNLHAHSQGIESAVKLVKLHEFYREKKQVTITLLLNYSAI